MPNKLNIVTIDAKGKPKTELYTFESSGDAERAYSTLRAFRSLAARATSAPTARGVVVKQEVTVFQGSMNMGDAPTVDDVSAWVLPGSDIYAFSLQEAGYKPEGGGTAEAHVQATLARALGDQYQVVLAVSLGPIRNIVFVRSSLAPLVSEVVSGTEATGIGHVVSNKGGVGIGFKLAETSFLFVASHLAAHDGEVERRNSDYREILHGLSKLAPKGMCASDYFDHVFWAGDLNYRLEMGRDEAITLITAGNIERLLLRDQLRVQHTDNKVFFGFTEGEITFTPTYKFEPGTREFDSKKMRTPSYTDRILFRATPPYAKTLVQTRYDACHTIMTSDHSPIFATFATNVLLHPYVPADLSAPGPSRTLVISRLAGRGLRAMDLNGFSDPYCVFSGSCVSVDAATAKTPVVKKSLEPMWAENFRLPVAITDPAFLAMHPLCIIVMDEDKTSKDDVIGAGWLDLSAALAAPDGVFELTLRADGLPAGVITGVVQLE
eukprot:a2259_55.p1 GENE.a2259_55~~a2259_55.p1  ORF type:complete len:561 (+),score=246.68 a2259_55:206-1684(+)